MRGNNTTTKYTDQRYIYNYQQNVHSGYPIRVAITIIAAKRHTSTLFTRSIPILAVWSVATAGSEICSPWTTITLTVGIDPIIKYLTLCNNRKNWERQNKYLHPVESTQGPYRTAWKYPAMHPRHWVPYVQSFSFLFLQAIFASSVQVSIKRFILYGIF